jgi:hypothetical protein
MKKMPQTKQQKMIVGTCQRKCSSRPLSGNRINTRLQRKLYFVPVLAMMLLVPADKYVLAGETSTAPLIAPLYILLSSAPTTTAGPSVSGTTDTATTLSATINENGTGYYLVQEATVAAPTVAAVLAGTSFAMIGGVTATQAINGLVALTPYEIYFVAKDAAGNVQTAVQSVDVTTAAEPDTTPNDFDFGSAVVVALSTLTESAPITVSGINTASPISVTNGEYQIDSGGWTTIQDTVSNGQTVKVRHTSSAAYATTTFTNLTIGGFTDAFGTTTITANYVTQGGLSWMPITFTGDYSSADTYCTTKTINGQTGWRMPTEAELSSLYTSGAMNGQGWTLASSVRSSTWNPGETAHSLVDLDDSGYIYTGDDSLTYLYVSCVRPIDI